MKSGGFRPGDARGVPHGTRPPARPAKPGARPLGDWLRLFAARHVSMALAFVALLVADRSVLQRAHEVRAQRIASVDGNARRNAAHRARATSSISRFRTRPREGGPFRVEVLNAARAHRYGAVWRKAVPAGVQVQAEREAAPPAGRLLRASLLRCGRQHIARIRIPYQGRALRLGIKTPGGAAAPP